MGYYDGVLCKGSRGLTSRYVLKRMSSFVDGQDHFLGAMNNAPESEENNAEIVTSGGLIARTRISNGTEITIPYGTGYWHYWKAK